MASSRIFVKGLPPNINEADFRRHFSANNREVTDIKLIPQRRIGYVGYKTADDASKAVKYFHKSYVRMSRISVESARPISDANQSKHDAARDTAATSAKRKVHEAAVHTDTNDTAKKRKKDVDQNDPKLREFLRVMGSAKENILDEAGDISHTTSTEPQNAVPEGESDDEYEQIPTKRERPKEPVHSARSLPIQSPVAVSEATKSQRQGDAAEIHEDEGIVEEDKPSDTERAEKVPEATDDDWLRSRTSRLLDLMDPEEMVATQSRPSDQASTKQITDEQPEPAPSHSSLPDDAVGDDKQTAEPPQGDDTLETIRRTSRLFIRNLPYSTTEDDLRECFVKFGTVQEVHIPLNKTGTSKGFAMVLFDDSSNAVDAYQSMDGATFQGRIIHIIPASAKRDAGLDEYEISKLPLKKQNMIRKKAESASNTFNWNSLYMSQDAVNASVATRLGVSKSELLDHTSADAAVKQAIAETTVIQDTKAYFIANGVDLDAFKSHKRGDTAILVKNFPYGTTIEEIRGLFEEFGTVLRVLMPPSGTIAIVQFAQANHAKTAFMKLSYRRVKDSVLFLEKAPKDLLVGGKADLVPQLKDRPTGTQKLNVDELLSRGDEADSDVETTSLFVRNLNFDTTTGKLAEAFEPLDGFVAARVKTKMDPKRPGQTLSMGFGFVEFRTKGQAQEALKVMDGHVLDGHKLAVKASHRGLDAAEERRREDQARKAAGQRTKIIIKNLPFQATKKDVRALFGTYGQLRSVRVPKKVDHSTKGFAFADFVTPREAENALNSLRDTHLLGRRLVLDYAEAEAADAEEEIAKMQRKVGGQVNKVALQQLTGGGRKKVNIGNNEDELEFEG